MMPGSGKVVGIYNKQSKAVSMTGNMLTAKETAIKKAVLKTGDVLVWDIPKYLLNEEREIEVDFSNITYTQLRSIKKLLKKQKEILDIVDMGRWKRKRKNRGNVHISLRTSYLGVTVDDIIDTLSDFNYKFDIEQANKYFLKVVLK